MRRFVYSLLAGLLSGLLMLLTSPAYAHFQLNVNIRIVHVEHVNDGLLMYLRVPTPYVLAQHLGEAQQDGRRKAAPFTYNRIVNEELMHYVDYKALNADSNRLGQMIADGHQLVNDDEILSGTVREVRLYSANQQPPFATLEEAKAAFQEPIASHEDQETFVGDTVTDVVIYYPSDHTVYDYRLSSSLNPGLENQEETANLVLDYFPGGTQVFRATGLLADPVIVSRSAIAAALTFIKEGIVHILKGYDHVLFVICLVIGATTAVTLLWRVTGFTLGHSVTLTLGFFGWVPAAPWFIPAIETGIALSIIYAAVIAVAKVESKSTFLVTAVIGLLHGLGFSFVLQEILQVNAPNIWQSLLAFNVGVEIGQLAIVVLIWPILLFLSKTLPALAIPIRWTIAIPCILLAALWTGERLVMVWNAL